MMDLKSINDLAQKDMQGVNALIGEQLSSDVALINQLGMYIVNSGGKRLRPLLAVLSCRALGYEGRAHLSLATIIEFILPQRCCMTMSLMNRNCAVVARPLTRYLVMKPRYSLVTFYIPARSK